VRLSVWRRRFCAPAIRGVGLDHLRPHDLRHTAVALWIAAGANPKEAPGGPERELRARQNPISIANVARTPESDTVSDREAKAPDLGEQAWALRDSNPRPQPCEGSGRNSQLCL